MVKSDKLLHELLVRTPSRRLFALLAMHKFAISSSQPKTILIEQLQQHLTQPATLNSILAQLDPLAKDACHALLMADGALPVHTFESRFGAIRPYRPWRKDDQAGDPQPWLAPISATETLWYLGLIYPDPPKRKPGIVQQYILPMDLIPLLMEELAQADTRLGSPSVVGPVSDTSLPHPGHNGPLEHHLAIWLATINERTIRPVHKRWLPPSVVALLCARLGLDQEDDFVPIRSERHHPYLAFLHYLALAADLIAITPTSFQLTPTAWAWLDADAVTRQAQLYAAWCTAPAELAHPFGFRWEPLSTQARAFVIEHLTQLPAEQPLLLAQLIAQWRLLDAYELLPGPRPEDWYDEATLYDPLSHLITGPLHWLGLVTLYTDMVMGHS